MNSHASADLIVVGSGVAGLSAALAAAEKGSDVLLVTAGVPLSGSSWCAQGGIAAAVGHDDSPAKHAADTLLVGADLNDRRAVEVLVEEGRRAVLHLLESGVPFDGEGDGPALGLEAGHSHRRILHAGGGATGEMVSAALVERAERSERITLLPYTPVDSLLLEGGRVAGVSANGKMLRASAVLLATGGYAGLWGRSTNPPGNRGFGLYLAWQAGATLADLEFVQYHPTALDIPVTPACLLSEALRGEGALLVDGEGREVLDPLLPRDVVARAIFRHIKSEGPVYLTMRHLNAGRVHESFPSIARLVRACGFDLARDPLPVAPAAHYCMGGVRADAWGRTDVAGLYVAGEVACTGAQGANRLASNSLLECLVFGKRAAHAAISDPHGSAAEWSGILLSDDALHLPSPAPREEHYSPGALGKRLDSDLGVEREPDALANLAADLPDPACAAPADHLIASLAARAALMRTESRGAHYRTDVTTSRPEWRGRILWRRGLPPHFEEVPN